MQIDYTLKRELANYDFSVHIHKSGLVSNEVNKLLRDFLEDLEELKSVEQERVKENMEINKINKEEDTSCQPIK